MKEKNETIWGLVRWNASESSIPIQRYKIFWSRKLNEKDFNYNSETVLVQADVVPAVRSTPRPIRLYELAKVPENKSKPRKGSISTTICFFFCRINSTTSWKTSIKTRNISFRFRRWLSTGKKRSKAEWLKWFFQLRNRKINTTRNTPRSTCLLYILLTATYLLSPVPFLFLGTRRFGSGMTYC